MHILVIGDSYCPADALKPAFEGLAGHKVTFATVRDDPSWEPTTPSELRLKEYLGSPAQVIAVIADHDVLVVQGAPVSDKVIAAAAHLKLICVARGGPVNVDVEAASARGIPVVTTPGKNATAVAELTLALMVMLARRIPEGMRHVGSGAQVYIDNYEGAEWFGRDLASHAVGLVGFGQIGRRVATRARAFEMRVLAFDPYVDEDVIRGHSAEPVALDRLLSEADFVSLHARATPENARMFGAARFAQMKVGAYFINTSRDVLVDEDALDDALRSGHLGGTALDVAAPSRGGQHRLLATPNVVLLPHVGGATIDTLENGGRMAVAEIERFAAGEPLVNIANPAAVDVLGATR